EDAQPGQIVVADRGCFSHQTVHQPLERQPDRYRFNLMCPAAGGYGSVEDALAIYQRRCAERDRDRERRRQRLAATGKKSA
ncbi:MAG: hypothetical protein WC058_12180, partial [Phycisphaeraceae bacterium]